MMKDFFPGHQRPLLIRFSSQVFFKRNSKAAPNNKVWVCFLLCSFPNRPYFIFQPDLVSTPDNCHLFQRGSLLLPILENTLTWKDFQCIIAVAVFQRESLLLPILDNTFTLRFSMYRCCSVTFNEGEIFFFWTDLFWRNSLLEVGVG